ncbi:MAG: hypothetical protein A2887_00500 [Alphaproteobacteria bacterium RIFCSPLOWO2_01_FULL_40_26]|nr:MAG: hypothetical protein A3D15_00870 [Alphaproteobacteria bacterium RIFCSPHIGHO2_02_FULL_40_34]OFW94668.1 MAG: hypothetical protein A2887_00500 [Alphaproteobacteria bacterium RIFCSPLOWO2_01_FULL_40_26]OFX10136.1 MAG: hypothetical protein A3H30_04960 [Alphaproteobacteria bacterium RIFCSPLOWO2_02_FULL_40_19]OFX11765.1 MAG: hypothetical protein A3G22_04550 [Alphaproteobacteria bacterium RIFCSPLOWO2_12_FULL_40_11]
MNFFQRLSDNSQGIFYNIICCFFASILIAIARHLSAEFHVFFIVMLRNFFALVFFLPQIVRDHNKVFKTQKINLHIWRAINGLLSMFVWFYAISILPLSEAVAISFIAPILTTLAAMIFLKEKVKSHIWIAVFVGFMGILIVLRPGFKDLNIAHLAVIFSTSLWVITNLFVKVMARTERPQTIVAYMSLVMFIISIPFALPYMKPINFENFCYFAALGLVSNLTHIFMSRSFAKVDLSLVQPFDFTRLIFTTIIAYFTFGEIIDFWVVIGSMVILSGAIIVIPKRNARLLQTGNINS